MYIDLVIGNLSLGICAPAVFPTRRRMTMTHIRDTVEDFYCLRPGALLRRSCTRNTAQRRQIVMYLVRELTGKTYPNIAKIMGGYDHTTIMHGVKEVERRIATDPDLAADVEVLRGRLGG